MKIKKIITLSEKEAIDAMNLMPEPNLVPYGTCYNEVKIGEQRVILDNGNVIEHKCFARLYSKPNSPPSVTYRVSGEGYGICGQKSYDECFEVAYKEALESVEFLSKREENYIGWLNPL